MTAPTKQETGKKRTTAEVIAMFRGLNLPVTDDQDRIEARGKELEPLYLRRKASPDAQQRNEADRWFKYFSQLKSQRPALLEIVYNDFIQLADTVLEVALNLGTNHLTPEVYAQLEEIALEQCNCDTSLARHFLEKYRQEKGLALKGALVSPHLVEQLTAESVQKGIRLSWKIPAVDCDEVVVVRFKANKNGKFAAKGKELCRGRRSGYMDNDVRPGMRCRYDVYSIYRGVQSQAAAVCETAYTPDPPPGVPSVFARYGDGVVNITWEPAPTEKPVEYHVLRRQGAVLPKNTEDGDMLPVTTQTRCRDRDVTAGMSYTYTVYTLLDEVYSRGGTSSAPVNILAEVTGLTAKSGDRTIELHWKTPLNAARVLVRRDTRPPAHINDGHPVPITGAGHAGDQNLENGKTYHYLVCCTYRPNGGGELISKGLRIDTSPNYLPAEVKDFTLQGVEKEVVCTWTPPGHGQVVVIRSSTPHRREPGYRLTVEQMDGLGKRVTTGKNNAHDLKPDIREPYYSIFTVAGTHAVAGGHGYGVVYPDITGLKYQTTPDGVILNWVWPEGCNAVRIVRKEGQWPESPDDPEAAHIACSRVDYKGAGEKYTDRLQQQEGTFYYTVYARVPGVDRLFFSRGKNPGCRARVFWKPWMTLRYKLSNLENKEKNKNGPGLLLTWNIENPHKDFNGFIVVAGQNSPPASPAEGIELFRRNPGQKDTGDSNRAWLDLSPVRKNGWSHFCCKLFVTDPAQRANTLVIHPNTCLPISGRGIVHHNRDTAPINGSFGKRFTVPRTVICPYCFDRFPLEKMLFDSFDGGEPRLGRYTLINRLLGRLPKPPKNKRGQVLTRKLCPRHKHHLPFTAGMQGSLVIGVIGAKFSGKSHYIASLVDQLSGQVGTDFQAGLMSVTDETAERYRREFHDPLFGQGFELPATSPNPPPLIYDLNLSGKLWEQKNNRTVTLVLYDTAGEDLETPERVRQMVKYLGVASGIIFLVDPLQAPGVRDVFPADHRISPREFTAEPSMIISRVLKELENGKVLSRTGPLDTPVAVVLSKCDILKEAGLLENNRLWNTDERHVGYFNREIHDDMAGMMAEAVQQWSLKAYNAVNARFSRHAFFGVSATGCASGQDHRYKYIAPWRVADPLLWLLAQLGVIPSK